MFKLDSNILIVDDMMTMRKIVKQTCAKLGFKNFTEAQDGVDAWNKISSAPVPFDFIISDWNMPNCTGLELLKKVRADAKLKSVPFLLVTAEAEKTQILEAMKAGVSGYVVKPFSSDALAARLAEMSKKLAA